MFLFWASLIKIGLQLFLFFPPLTTKDLYWEKEVDLKVGSNILTA